MQSVDDAYSVALAGKQVDVAPLGQTLVKTYLAKYEQDGATTIEPGVRDDAWTLYTPTTVLEDANKAAALKEYVDAWAKAQQWIADNPDEFAQAYYVEHEGLSTEDAKYIVDVLGTFAVPTSWDDVIARHQETADTLVEEQDQEPLDVDDLYDRRYEKAIAAAVEGVVTTVPAPVRARPGRSPRRRTYAPPGAGSAPASRSASAGSSASSLLLAACGSSAPPPGCSTSAP